MIPGAISTKSAAKAPQQCANKVGLITKAADAAKTTKGGIKTVCCKIQILNTSGCHFLQSNHFVYSQNGSISCGLPV